MARIVHVIDGDEPVGLVASLLDHGWRLQRATTERPIAGVEASVWTTLTVPVKRRLSRFAALARYGGIAAGGTVKLLAPLPPAISELFITTDGIHISSEVIACTRGDAFLLEVLRAVPGALLLGAADEDPAGDMLLSRVAWARLARGDRVPAVSQLSEGGEATAAGCIALIGGPAEPDDEARR